MIADRQILYILRYAEESVGLIYTWERIEGDNLPHNKGLHLFQRSFSFQAPDCNGDMWNAQNETFFLNHNYITFNYNVKLCGIWKELYNWDM